MRRIPLLTAAAVLVAWAGTASAHPKLVSSSPSARATVAAPARVALHFSEKLIPAFSKADLTMAGKPGMAAMKMPSTSTVAADGRTLVITPRAKLPAGRYAVGWHVVSTDTHKAAGSYSFAVK